MDEMRLILLGIGVLVVAGIYLASRRTSRPPAGPLEDPPPASTVASDRPEPADPEWVGGGFSAALDGEDLEALPEVSAREEPGMVVVLTIVAREGDLEGPAILEAAAGSGLRTSGAGVFHYYADPQGHEPWFGVANILEPGVFDFSAMEDFATPGLVCFLQLPGPADGEALFERFIETARALADRLDGVLGDEGREPLDAERLDALRDRVRSQALLAGEGG